MSDQHRRNTQQLNVINVSQPTPAERNVFTITQNTKGDPEESRLKLIKRATDNLSAEQEATREVEKLKLEQKEKRKAEAKEQRKQKEKQEVVIEKFTAANRLHTQFLRNFGTKAPIDGTWAAYDEAEAALNAIKFKAEVNEAMRLDIDKLLSSLEQYSAKHLAM